jgi:hypothetical protein
MDFMGTSGFDQIFLNYDIRTFCFPKFATVNSEGLIIIEDKLQFALNAWQGSPAQSPPDQQDSSMK